MRRSILGLAACLLWFGFAGISLGAEPATKVASKAAGPALKRRIDADDVRPHVEYLASEELAGRSKTGGRLAANYIRDHFRRSGLVPLFPGGSYFQEIPGLADENGEAAIVGRNVGALLPGSDPELKSELIILSAHYDHLGTRGGEIYPGADDNASGVAMMLEVSRRLASQPVRPRRSIAFVGFDLEERMLWGSRWFVAHAPWELEQIKFFMTADMIGRSLGDLPLPAVFVLGSEHAPAIKDVLDRVDAPQELEVCRLGIDLVGTRSDYGPFRDRKIPFLFFSTGEHPDYHTPRDIPERVDYEKVANVSELVLNVCLDTAGAEKAPEWTDDIGGDLDEPRALNRIATLLLEAEKDRPLNDVQRMLVTHAKNKTDQILDRGSMEQSERTWLIRVSQVMLFSVF